MPRELPASPSGFVGRAEQLARLDSLPLAEPAAAPVAIVTGMAASARPQALALFDEVGEVGTRAYTWDTLGFVYRRRRDDDQAVTCYRHAIALHQRGGDRLDEAMAWTQLGDTSADAGQPGDARHAWRRAVAILDDLTHPDAASVRTRIETGVPPEQAGPPDR